MTAPFVSVVVEADAAKRRIARLRGRFANWKPVLLGPVRVILQEIIRMQFQTSGQFAGTPWQELSESRRRQKSRAGTLRRGILRHSMQMYESFVRYPHPDQIVQATPTGLRLLSTLDRSRAHQLGLGHMPQRIMVPPADRIPTPYITRLRNAISGYAVEAGA